MIQQQNYSLAAIAKRDAKEDPFAKEAPEPSKPANDEDPEEEAAAAAQRTAHLLRKELKLVS